MSVSQDEWPHGLSEEVAVIEVPIEHVERTMNVSFGEAYDDLDWYKYHVFEFDRGLCALVRYRNAQVRGLTLVVEGRHASDLDNTIKSFLEKLGLGDYPITWRRPAGMGISGAP